MQAFHTFDCEQVGAYARNAGTHAAKHLAKLLDIWFAGCIIDSGCALCRHCGHDYVGSPGDGGFVEKHVSSLQTVRRCDSIESFLRTIIEFRAQLLQSYEMRVESAAPDFIAARFGKNRLTETGQQRTQYHYGSSQ